MRDSIQLDDWTAKAVEALQGMHIRADELLADMNVPEDSTLRSGLILTEEQIISYAVTYLLVTVKNPQMCMPTTLLTLAVAKDLSIFYDGLIGAARAEADRERIDLLTPVNTPPGDVSFGFGPKED